MFVALELLLHAASIFPLRIIVEPVPGGIVSTYKDLRERIPEGQKHSELPLERRISADVVAHPDLDELRPPLRDEVDLLLVQLSDVGLVTSPHQLEEDRHA